MEELKPKDEQLEENQETALKDEDLDSGLTEKKPFMQTLREKAEDVPSAVKEGATKAVQFVKDHKKEIAAGTVAVIGAVAYVASNTHEKNQLRDENAQLEEENGQLSDDLEIERGVSDCLASRVVELEDLCEEKDDYFREAISDGLRHGSSLAGKHMADRKQYLSEE